MPMTLLLGVSASLTASAATWTVDASGGADYAAIGDAIAAASSGDRIEIAAGTYAECLYTDGRSLDIVGIDGAAMTTLAPSEGCDNALSIYSGESVYLAGLTITNPSGRGIYLYYSALSLSEVTISGSGRTDWSGGAVYAFGATLDLTRCAFSGNQAYDGGAIYLYGYDALTDDSSTFSGNYAAASGGALYAVYDDDVTLSGTHFDGNTAAGSGGAYVGSWYTRFSLDGGAVTDNIAEGGYGGGLYFYAVSNPVEISDTEISGNTSATYGGGISVWWYADMFLSGVTVADNTSGGDAGGVFFYPGDSATYDLTITESAFTGNVAAVSGGGLWAGWVRDTILEGSRFEDNVAGASASGGGALLYVADTWSASGNTFCQNTAGYGGGASVQWTNSEDWTNNTFIENDAYQGGGAYRSYSYDGRMSNNTFVGNGADYGGAYHAYYGYADFRNNVVAWSTAGNGGYYSDPYSYSYGQIAWSGWYENQNVHGGGYFYVVLDDEDGNLEVDPGFVAWSLDGDCSNDDLRLAAGSSLRDAGDPEILDLDGSVSDVGAWGGPGAPVEDYDGDGFDTTADCVDTDAAVSPDAEEICDGVDNDCDGDVDGGAVDASAWYPDGDGDGYGDDAGQILDCGDPNAAATDTADPGGDLEEDESAWVQQGGDCDDADETTHPEGEEIPDDGIDQDCDGVDATLSTGDTGDVADDTGAVADDTDMSGDTGAGESKGGRCATVTVDGVTALWLAGLFGFVRRR